MREVAMNTKSFPIASASGIFGCVEVSKPSLPSLPVDGDSNISPIPELNNSNVSRRVGNHFSPISHILTCAGKAKITLSIVQSIVVDVIYRYAFRRIEDESVKFNAPATRNRLGEEAFCSRMPMCIPVHAHDAIVVFGINDRHLTSRESNMTYGLIVWLRNLWSYGSPQEITSKWFRNVLTNRIKLGGICA